MNCNKDINMKNGLKKCLILGGSVLALAEFPKLLILDNVVTAEVLILMGRAILIGISLYMMWNSRISNKDFQFSFAAIIGGTGVLRAVFIQNGFLLISDIGNTIIFIMGGVLISYLNKKSKKDNKIFEEMCNEIDNRIEIYKKDV